jgi:hypothetical protein
MSRFVKSEVGTGGTYRRVETAREERANGKLTA